MNVDQCQQNDWKIRKCWISIYFKLSATPVCCGQMWARPIIAIAAALGQCPLAGSAKRPKRNARTQRQRSMFYVRRFMRKYLLSMSLEVARLLVAAIKHSTALVKL